MNKPQPALELIDPRIAELNDWLVHAGVQGMPREAMLEAYCVKLVEMGVPLLRFNATQNAVHPVYGALGFAWKANEGHVRHEYEHVAEAPDAWLASPFYHMLRHGLEKIRIRMPDVKTEYPFPVLNELKHAGATDYVARSLQFAPVSHDVETGRVRIEEGALMSWMAHGPDGFSDGDLGLIRGTFASLCLVLKSGTHNATARDLLSIYLGQDAGRRVLSGEIQRGSSRWIDAVIVIFDLEGFTNLSQQIEGEALIQMLNDYFGLAVHEIESRGGNVLKFMGDGMLAIFDRDAMSDAPDRALDVVRAFAEKMPALSTARQEDGAPTLGYAMALHAGRVLYGNIGANERLDFTVIGPEVNLAARLSEMHRPLGQRIILSQDVAQGVLTSKGDLVPLGRYMLRGVAHPVELYTVYEG